MAKLFDNPKTININGEEITYYRINNDVNGNPRYVVHFLALNIRLADYGRIKLAAKKYHTKQFGGGYVFQSYSVESDLRHILDQVSEHYEVMDNIVPDHAIKLRNFKSFETAKFYAKKIQPRYTEPLKVGVNHDGIVVYYEKPLNRCTFCGREDDADTRNVGGYLILSTCDECESEILGEEN